jgi:hypothetical protein
MDLYVGQKVRCVRETDNDRAWQRDYAARCGIVFPTVGAVYTVRWLGIYKFEGDSKPALRVVEITNPVTRWLDGDVAELAFNINRFRPLDERKTDISVFTSLLAPSPKKILS